MSGFYRSCVAFALIVLLGRTSFSHHSIAIEHDTKRTLGLSGIIKETDWNNPHAFLRLDVNGKTWLVTLLAPNALKVKGLDRSSLVVGKSLSVVGYPNRGLDEVYAQRITIDGKTIEFFPR